MAERVQIQTPNAPAIGASLTLRIGDIRIALESDDALAVIEAGASEQFLVDAGEPDIRLTARWGDLRYQPPAGEVFDSGVVWRLYAAGGNHLFRFVSPISGETPYKELLCNPSFTSGEITLHRDFFEHRARTNPLEFPLDELLIVHYLSQGHGVEVHACGIEDRDGRGYLFLGQSGAGKTTTARLWDHVGGVRILSDDRIILRLLDGCLWMYGTPWHGEGRFSSPARARLDRIYFLAHGVANSARSLRPAAAVPRLMACSFLPFHSAAGLDFAFRFLEQATGLAPVFRLEFVPDVQVVDFVRSQAV